MKLRNISCIQFAGMRDCSVSLTDGVNVIYGKNESGKSTLINLLSRTLFQNVKINQRIDKEFLNLYFPSARKGSENSGDFADGKLTFETSKGCYTLSKEWGTQSRCLLSTPEGVFRDQEKINDILKEEFLYGEGVYAEILLSSQKNSDDVLQRLLDASVKTDAKQEITNAVSLAFAESDGISVDAIEQEINARIEQIAGKHWDFERELPVRKTGVGRWMKERGEILNAYYELEDAEEKLRKLDELEKEADQARSEYAKKDEEACSAEQSYTKFHTFVSRLALWNERKKTIESIEEELKKLEKLAEVWPQLETSLKKAKKLQKEKYCRETADQYRMAKQLKDELNLLCEELKNANGPEEEEILQVRSAQRSIAALEGKLCGMNLTAAIQIAAGHKIQIVSLRTGKELDISGSCASIDEAVRIIIPEVMELQLSPADVHPEEVRKELDRQKKTADAILAKYKVKTLEEMEMLMKRYAELETKRDRAKTRLELFLKDLSFEELEEKVQELPSDIRSQNEIAGDIAALCGTQEIGQFLAVKESQRNSCVSEYYNIPSLNRKIADLAEKLKTSKASAMEIENIPKEYQRISDPESYLEKLQDNLKRKQQIREMALQKKTEALSRMETEKENCGEDVFAEVEKKKNALEEKKTMLAHWMHIREVFYKQKENLHENPLLDLEESFAGYLKRISDGSVLSEFPEADKLNMNIYSKNRLLDYGKLSEGTKETVALAFRLAVLEHLFPEGGGVIVFDDPFTDMDAERTEQSCRLIRECAARHQVIFLTCREEYLERIGGNCIRL